MVRSVTKLNLHLGVGKNAKKIIMKMPTYKKKH